MGLVVSLGQKKSLMRTFQDLIHPKIWLHRSTSLDFQLMFTNSALRILLFLFISVSSVGVARVVVSELNDLIPGFQAFTLSHSNLLILYTIASFVVIDFFRFYQHYLFHKISFLWRFHEIHHSAEVMTPMTLYRTHPVESLISSLRQVLVLGVFTGVFIFMTQSMISAYVIFGVNALDFAFNFFGSNLRHSHIWVSFGLLNYIFVSPAQHQIHHSRSVKHHDKNLGFSLAIWDLLFGTFYKVKTKEFIIYGVRGRAHKNMKQALLTPFSRQNPNQGGVS